MGTCAGRGSAMFIDSWVRNLKDLEKFDLDSGIMWLDDLTIDGTGLRVTIQLVQNLPSTLI